MERSRGLLSYLTEAFAQWYAARHLTGEHQAKGQPGGRSRLARWFLPNGTTLLLVGLLIATTNVWARSLSSPASQAGPGATTVNYQGRLADSGGNPLDGAYGMTFALWDAPTEGNLVWGPESHPAVPVSDGLFSVGLGSQTAGGIPTATWSGDRYLEISVSGETLNPRELIRAVPMAGMALTVPDGAIGRAQIAAGSVTSAHLSLDQGTACAPSTVEVPLSAGQTADVPELSVSFSLEDPSRVLVWIDGLARFDQASVGDCAVGLALDGTPVTSEYCRDQHWFNLNGQRLATLDPGTHTLSVQVSSTDNPGKMFVHGASPFRTCISYLVLGSPPVP